MFLLLLAGFGLGNLPKLAAEEIKDPSKLFPESSLAYLQVAKPEATFEVLRTLLAKTPLGAPNKYAHDARDLAKQPDSYFGTIAMARLMSVVSPEMLRELKKVTAVAAGLTEFDETSKPRGALVLLTGEATGIELLFRQYLLTARDVRRIGNIEGVAVYQNRDIPGTIPPPDLGNEEEPGFFDMPAKPKDPNAKPKPEEMAVAEGTYESTYLLAPGIIIIGTGKAAVENVYRRYLGKETSRSLADTPEYTKAPRSGEAGLIFFARPPEFDAGFRHGHRVHRFPAAELVSSLRFLVNTQELPTVTGELILKADSIRIRFQGTMNDVAKSPLMRLTSGSKADVKLLTGPSGTFTTTLKLPEKDRASALVAVADALAHAQGVIGATPSERLAEAEKSQAGIAKSLDKIRSLTFTLDNLPSPQIVNLLLELETEKDAKDAAESLPRTLSALLNTPVSPPGIETIGDVRVLSIAIKENSLHFSTKGNRLAISRNQQSVAVLLDPAAKPRVEAIAGTQPTAMGEVQLSLLTDWIFGSVFEPKEPARNRGRLFMRQPPLEIDPTEKEEQIKQFQEVVKQIPACRWQLTRTDKSFILDIAVPDLRPQLANLLDAGLKAYSHSQKPVDSLLKGYNLLDLIK